MILKSNSDRERGRVSMGLAIPLSLPFLQQWSRSIASFSLVV